MRAALIVGLALTFAGFRWEVLVTTGSDFGSFVGPFALIGCGLATLYRALATVIFGVLPPQDLIMALVVYKMSGLLGAALATPFFATLLDHRSAAHRSDLAGSVALASTSVRAFVAGSADAVATLTQTVEQQAQTLAYADIWGAAAVVVAVLAPLFFALDVRGAVRTDD